MEQFNLVNLDLYPNPSAGKFNLIADEKIIVINIYDFSGRKVKSFYNLTEKLIKIDLEELGNGVYTVESIGENFKNHNKIVIKK